MTMIFVPLMAGLGAWGALLLVGVVFAETGIAPAFFLPGGAMLFAGGLYVASGVVPVPFVPLLVVTVLAAVAGDQVGFALGRRAGPHVFRPRGRIWTTAHVERARLLLERHGHHAVLLARFVPVARTFVPIVAGSLGMRPRRFVAWNVAGAVVWAGGIMLVGYFLGGVPWIAENTALLTVALVAVSFVVVAAHLLIRRLRTGHWRAPVTLEPVPARSHGHATLG
ncbi:DedA family protein [Nocardioides bruguierae]|uniref:DedA family protein n=1 Tax=Nocardioides bruguierae TaxID=2945102 RepID=UPI002020868A|nr:DedA family protein [Nocardioides bruguierae]MCL8027158.1 DedA family protein [Nocardioides bruguierae]